MPMSTQGQTQTQTQAPHGQTVILPPGQGPQAPGAAQSTQQQPQSTQSQQAPQSMQSPAHPMQPAPSSPSTGAQTQTEQAPSTQQAQQTPQSPQSPAPKRDESVVIEGQQFNSIDDALAHLESMAAQPRQTAQHVVPLQDILPHLQQQQTPQQQEQQSEDELYYQNPVEYTKNLINRAKSEVEQANEIKAQAAEAYQFMETRHPDMVGKRKLVDDITDQYLPAIQKLSTREQRADYIALRVRQQLRAWTGQPEQTQVLTNEQPIPQPQGGGGAPGQGVTPAQNAPNGEKPLSFADSIRKTQQRIGY